MSEAIPTADDYRTAESYPLQVGDEVFDIKQLCEADMEAEPAVVIGIVDDDVHDVSFKNQLGDEVTLDAYDPNIRYADFRVSERVVTIAWESWLDNNVPRWEAHRDAPESLSDYLATCEESWDIPISSVGSYDYPESRLQFSNRPEDS